MTTPFYFRPKMHYPSIPFFRLLDRSASGNLEKPAVIYNEYAVSYRELVSMIYSLTNGLRTMGIAKGDKVGIMLPNSLEYILSVQAISRCGAVSSPINVSNKPSEVIYQLKTIGAKMFIVGNRFAKHLEEIKREVPSLEAIVVAEKQSDVPSLHGIIRQNPAVEPPEVEIGVDDPAMIPFSSGTTGLPKGVVLTHGNLVANYIQCIYGYSIRQTDVIPLFLPMYHIYGSMITGATLAAGGTLVLMERFNLQSFLKLSVQYRATIWFALPPVVNQISQCEDIERHQLSSVRYTLSGAAPLAQQIKVRFQEKTGINVVEGYGMTEAASFVSSPSVDYPQWQKDRSVGLPIPDTEVEIVDTEQGVTKLPFGQVGEIRVRGPQVMKEYWNNADATNEALRDGWYYTGDLGYLDEDGFLFIVDRKKEMIKYNGFAIAPVELETVLFTHPKVKDCAVCGKPDDAAGEIPIAFVVAHEQSSQLAEDIMAYVSERVSGYKRLKEVRFIDQIPRSGSGKILRRELKGMISKSG